MTCPHCLRLSAKVEAQRQQITDLQRTLGLRHQNGALGAMMERLSVTPTEALILGVLKAAAGRYVSTQMLTDSVELPTSENARCHVLRLRKKLGRGAIVTGYGVGYALSESGLRLVGSAMWVDCT